MTGASLVALSTKLAQEALQNQLLSSLAISAVVLTISSIVTLLLARRLTQPVLATIARPKLYFGRLEALHKANPIQLELVHDRSGRQ